MGAHGLAPSQPGSPRQGQAGQPPPRLGGCLGKEGDAAILCVSPSTVTGSRAAPPAGRGPALPPALPAAPGSSAAGPNRRPSGSPPFRRTRPGHPDAGRAAPATRACSPVTGPGRNRPTAINLPGHARPRPPVGGPAAAPGPLRHPFVFELTPVCRDSASPPDRAAGPFNSGRTTYPAAPGRPVPIGGAPPGRRGEAPRAHWLPVHSQWVRKAAPPPPLRRNLSVHFLF